MAINNTVGLLAAPRPTTPNFSGGSYAPAAKPVSQFPSGGSISPQPVSGLLTAPSHPKGQVTSSTITTNPDMSTVHKQTYDTGASTDSSKSNAPTTQNGNPYIAPVAQTSTQGNPAATTAIQNLGNTQAGTPATQGYIGQTAGYGANIADQFGQKIADTGQRGAAFEAGQLTTGTSPVAQGGAAVTAQTTAAQQAALAQGETAALQGTGQELTAQQQAANAANAAAGQSNTAQGTQVTGQSNAASTGVSAQGTKQSGLISAGTLAQPQLGAIGQVPFSPIDLSQGSPLGAPGGTAADAARVAGQFQGAQAAAAGPGIGAGTGAAASAAAGGQTAAQNAIATGTAGTSAASTAYQNAVQGVSKATAQYTGASGVAQNLTSTLGSWTQSGVLTNYNQALNKIAGLTSSPQYAQFVAALTNTQAAYTAAFQTAGITPTQSTENALKELDPNSSAAAIVASLNQLSSDLHAATIVPAYQQQQFYGKQLGIQQ